jgi:hypothetical protein
MTVTVYVSSGLCGCPEYGFLAPNAPLSLLPRTESWKHVGSADAFELGLSDTEVKGLIQWGFGTRKAAGGYSIR